MPRRKNWCACWRARERTCAWSGDEDQSIYGWRGARAGNLKRFTEDFPGAKIIRLEENYRSTQTILDAAAAVVGNNSDRLGKNLQGNIGDGQAPDLFRGAGLRRRSGVHLRRDFRFAAQRTGRAGCGAVSDRLAVAFVRGNSAADGHSPSRGGRLQLLRARGGAQCAGVRALAVSSRGRCFAAARSERAAARDRGRHGGASRRARERNEPISLGRDSREANSAPANGSPALSTRFAK